jgi:hypothetical protein
MMSLTALMGIKSTQVLMGILLLFGLTATRYIRVGMGMTWRIGLKGKIKAFWLYFLLSMLRISYMLVMRGFTTIASPSHDTNRSTCHSGINTREMEYFYSLVSKVANFGS